jgi:hypothetical protein
VGYFEAAREECESDVGWLNAVTATKNALRSLSNLILAYPQFYETVRSMGVDQEIFGMVNSLGSCLTDDGVESVLANETDANCYLKYTENDCRLASVAGMLAFYEAVVKFDVPDTMASVFLQFLRFGSRYLTNYALKVIERLMIGTPELCGHFAVSEFVGLFLMLSTVSRCEFDLGFVFKSEARLVDQGALSPSTLRARRRWLHIGYHSLGILANLCRLHDPVITRVLLEHGILEYDVIAHEIDSDLIRQFFTICKHILLTPECASQCLERHSMELVFGEWDRWTSEFKREPTPVMAYIYVRSVDSAVGRILCENRAFLETLVEHVWIAKKKEQKIMVIKALLLFLRKMDIPRRIAEFLVGRREDLKEVEIPDGEGGELLFLLLSKLTELSCG